MTLSKHIAKRLKIIRNKSGLSQKDLISVAGLKTTQQIFSRYELGIARIPSHTLFTLAKALDVDINEFVRGAK
jgi:transcriptional regulator with XRE-family HTH domain